MNRFLLSLAVLAAACRPTSSAEASPPAPRNVRPAAWAGQFYPADPGELAGAVKALMAGAPRVAGAPVRIVLAPHAGLPFSGAIAAAAFRQLDPGFDRAVIVAANHDGRSFFSGFSVDRASHYAVPGLVVPVAADAAALAGRPGSVAAPTAHGNHMIEIELPFLAEANGGRPFEIVPAIVGQLSREGVEGLADALAQLARPGTVFVFSVDLSHYLPYDEASRRDRSCLDALVRADARDFLRCDTDGTQVLAVMEGLGARLGATPRLVAYANSGDTGADRGRVVGYGAIAWEDRIALAPGEREALLALARASLARAVKEHRPADVPPEVAGRFPRLRANGAAFVTLKEDGRLRGCIGTLDPREPLLASVSGNALRAALADPRFPPVRSEELPRLHVSVSVLGPKRPLAAAGADLLRRLGAERPGVVLEHAGRSSTFLPMVWAELPDPAQFLAALCEKQGSAPTCWTRPETRFEVYAAEEIE